MEKAILPLEVSELAIRVPEKKQQEVKNILNQIFLGTDDWEKQVDLIEVKGVEDTMSIQLAEVARKNAKTARISAEKIFDAKRLEVQNLKAEYDLEDKLWLKAKQVMQIKFKAIEEKAEWKANFAKRYEAEQKELRTQARISEVSKYGDINRIEFENMTDISFASFINGLKSTYEAKIEAEKRAEEERLEKERKIKEEMELQVEIQRVENEKLRAEAEKRKKELAKEKEKLRAEKEAKEKIEAELKAKRDAEIEAENKRKAEELKAKKEAEKLAKAPVKKQLKVWVNSFSIPESEIYSEVKINIIQKFESFKRWAISEIDNM